MTSDTKRKRARCSLTECLFGVGLLLLGCGVQPIPSIGAPTDIAVSSLSVPVGEVVVLGRPGSVPGRATVFVAADDERAEVTAADDGTFSTRIVARVGGKVEIVARMGTVDSPASTRVVLSTTDAAVPSTPGSTPGSPVTVGIPDVGGLIEVAGSTGAVSGAAEVAVTTLGRAHFTVADASGSFSVRVPASKGEKIAVLSVVGGVCSPAKNLTVPATPGELDDDGDEVQADHDCDDDDHERHENCDSTDGQDGQSDSQDDSDGASGSDDGGRSDGQDDGVDSEDPPDGSDSEDLPDDSETRSDSGEEVADGAEGADSGGDSSEDESEADTE